ncbi:glycosyl hydrolase 108 family protein [Pelagibius sp. CAU 1746]|uniref:glycosyl hydrolase 108 family protein n=1 Tax=Pelagibius sp. CAU 1746 TaxID=3140370 RepID=UPI00325BCBA4
MAEEEARRLQAEDPRAAGGFWVRDRKNRGLIYVVPNPGPNEADSEKIMKGESDDVLIGQAGAAAPTAAQSFTGSPYTNHPLSQQLPTEQRLFELFLRNLGPREGGIANRPPSADKGGPTKRGLSKAFLDELRKLPAYKHLPEDPRRLTDAQIDALYRAEKFDRPQIWKLAQIPALWASAPQLVEQIFDAGVLHGILDPGRWFQEALDEVMGTDLRSQVGGKLGYDGIIGSRTRKAAEQAVLAGKIVEVNNLMVDKRRAYVKSLPEFPPESRLDSAGGVISDGTGRAGGKTVNSGMSGAQSL